MTGEEGTGPESKGALTVLPPAGQQDGRLMRDNKGIQKLIREAKDRGLHHDLDDVIALVGECINAYGGTLQPDDLVNKETIEFLEGRALTLTRLHESKAKVQTANTFVATREFFESFCNKVGEAVQSGIENAAGERARQAPMTDGEKMLLASAYDHIMLLIAAIGFDTKGPGTERRVPGRR